MSLAYFDLSDWSREQTDHFMATGQPPAGEQPVYVDPPTHAHALAAEVLAAEAYSDVEGLEELDG